MGKKQDISDLIYLADVKNTVALSMFKKGAKITNTLFDFIVKTLGTRKKGGVPDGKDVNAFDTQNPKVVLQARTEVFRRAPMVGFIAQLISRAGGVAGTPNAMDEAMGDQLKEIARDMEKEIWSNQDSRPDDGVNGSQFRGLGRWIYNGTSTLTLDPLDTSPTTGYSELPVPAAARTPSNQIFTGSIATMSETDIGTLIQAKYENTGASSELIGFVTPVIKNRFGIFSRYTPNVTNFTSNVYVTSGRLEGKTLFGATVDVYQSDWGTFKLIPVLTDFFPTSYTAFFLDMDHVRIRTLEMNAHYDLPNLGGGPRELIQNIFSVIPGDPRAHSKIDGTA
ncbi:MAG: DUF5309 family protein [Pyrinomonadaceae bacterium]|nr:DUF5309 family protein [Pyrinomonadaceae bacterium]